MDPITMILTALGAGAVAGLSGTMSKAIEDAYNSLRDAVHRKFVTDDKALAVLEDFGDDPEVYERPLVRELQRHQVQDDPEVILLARTLLSAVESVGGQAGKYQVSVTGGQVGNIGDHGSVVIHGVSQVDKN